MNWFRKNEDEEHNFYQNYTDLLSGFLIVFIIASLLFYQHYQKERENFELEKQKYKALINMVGGTTGSDLTSEQLVQLDQLVANAQLYQKVAAFDSAQNALNSKYFHYDKKYRRYECVIDVQFDSDNYEIKTKYKQSLIKAGKELVDILRDFPQSPNVGFKVVIDGRAAMEWDKKLTEYSQARIKELDRMSYLRSRGLYRLWESNGITKEIVNLGGEIFTSGSGLEGQGRHSKKTDPNHKDPEGLNKRFVIQVIPFIKF